MKDFVSLKDFNIEKSKIDRVRNGRGYYHHKGMPQPDARAKLDEFDRRIIAAEGRLASKGHNQNGLTRPTTQNS